MNFKQIKIFFIKIIKFERITLFIISAIFFFLIIGMFVFSAYQTTKSIRKEIVNFENNALIAMAMSRAKHVETLLNNYKGITARMATGNPFRDVVDESVAYDLRMEQVNRRIKAIVDSNSVISRIRVLNKEGAVIASSHSGLGADKSFYEIFLKGKEDVYIRDIHISDYTKNKVISVAAPILLKEKFAGVIIVNFNVGELYDIVTNRTGLEESIEVYIVNKDNFIVTPSRFKENTFLTQKIDTINLKYCLNEKNSQEGRREHEVALFTNYRGINTVGTHVYIPQTQWCLLVEADEKEIFASISKILNDIWLFTVEMIIVIIIAGIIFNFLLTNSLKKEVADKTIELKKTLIGIKNEKYDLEKQRLATLNILEDVNESDSELKAINKFLTEKRHELEILRSFGVEMSSVLELEDAIKIFSEHLAKAVDFSVASFVIINKEEAGGIIYSAYLNHEISEQSMVEIENNLLKYLIGKKIKNLSGMVHVIKNVKPHIFGKKFNNNSRLKFKENNVYSLKIGDDTLGLVQLTASGNSILKSRKVEFIEAMISNLSISVSRLQTIVRSQNTKTSSLIESLNDGILMYDFEKNIVLMNPSATKYVGFKKEAVSLSDLYELFKEYKISEKIDLSLKIGKIFRFENIELGDYYFEIFIIPVKDINKKIVGGAMILRDITFLNKMDKMKTEFVSVASHQLRTPLTAIKLFTDMLIDSEVGKLNKKQAEYLDNIHESTERMVRLVNDLLNVTRIESGKLRVTPEPVILKDMVKGAIAEAKIFADNKKIKMDFIFDNDLTKIPIDQNLMRQVIHNLLINAIRYSRVNGGKIIVEVKRNSKDSFLIKVEDNGIGIPKETQKRIFEKFFRADNAIKLVTEGTGLGLYVSKMIVESSGGKIWFESKKNKGTSFFIKIPVKGMKKREGERGLAIS